MLVRKTFLQWLQEFSPKLHIMEHATNPDIDVLYHGKKRLCSIPKGLKTSKGWSRIHDKRTDAGYATSRHSIPHRSISGVGLVLLKHRIISSKQFVKYFISSQNRQFLEKCRRQGLIPKL